MPSSVASSSADSSPTALQAWASMTGVLLAMLMGSLDQTAVTTAMPRIMADLSGFAHYSGVISGYLIASTITIPIAGRISDMYGRKPLFILGVIWFTLASLLCGTATRMASLIFFRCLQGIGGGAMQSMAFTTIADLFPPARRGAVSGLTGSLFGFASVVGPTLGGFLTDSFGWRSIFVVNLPVGLAALAVIAFFFPSTTVKKEGPVAHLDGWGTLMMVTGVGLLMFGLHSGGHEIPWTSRSMAVVFGLSAASLVAFFWIEVRTKQPLIALVLWRQPLIARSLFAAAALAFAMMSTTLFAPLFLQAVLGLSARASGAAMIPMSLSTALASLVTGQLIQRTGRTRRFSLLGAGIMAGGLSSLAWLAPEVTPSSVTHRLMFVGLGAGMTMPIFGLIVQNVVAKRDLGAATASVQFVRTMGGALGLAILGACLTHIYSHQVHAHLDREVAAALSTWDKEALEDPQALLRPHVDTLLQHAIAGHTPHPMAPLTLLAAWRQATRVALADATQKIFALAAAVVLCGLAALWWIEERPLRRHVLDEEASPRTQS